MSIDSELVNTDTDLTLEQIKARYEQNMPKLMNLVPEPVQVKKVYATTGQSDAKPERATHTKTSLKQLDATIVHILELMPNKQATPHQIYQELKVNGIECTNKQISNKMWALEKASVVIKVRNGVYGLESAVSLDNE